MKGMHIQKLAGQPDLDLFDVGWDGINDGFVFPITTAAGALPNFSNNGHQSTPTAVVTAEAPESIPITTEAIASDVISLAGSSIVFHNTYGAGVTAAFHQAAVDAEHFLESHLTAGTTIDLYASFDFSSLGPLFSGQNNFLMYNESYATWRAQIAARSTSQDDAAAVAALPTTDPTGGLGVYLPSGYARMMGMNVGNDIDSIVLNSDLTFNFTDGDATGVLEHELTEGAMGRISSLGFRSFSNGTHYWNPMDFFRFQANGVRDYTGGQDGALTYFGFDAAHVFTNFQLHNSINFLGQYDGFDLADWDHTVGNSFGPGGPGSPGVVSPTDLRVMDVLGWRPTVPADDFPANASTTGTVAVNGAATGNLETLGDHDWFATTLISGHSYIIDERGSPSGGGTLSDAYLNLHNAASTVVATNDDGGVGFDSQLAVTVGTTGTYYIDAGAFADSHTGTYTVDVQDLGTNATGFQAPAFELAQFGAAAGGWSSDNAYPRELADVNGDGQADIVGFGQAGVRRLTGNRQRALCSAHL